MILLSLAYEAMEALAQEQGRLSLQTHLDALKSQTERNRLGQFHSLDGVQRNPGKGISDFIRATQLECV